MKKQYQSINQLLCNNATGEKKQLNNIMSRAETINAINNVLRENLPEQQIENCRVANLSGNSITLVSKNAAWCSRLRFNQHQILQLLRLNGYPWLANIDIKVAGAEKQTTDDTNSIFGQKKHLVKREISEKTLNSLDELSTTQHKLLAVAAQKLANTIRKKQLKK